MADRAGVCYVPTIRCASTQSRPPPWSSAAAAVRSSEPPGAGTRTLTTSFFSITYTMAESVIIEDVARAVDLVDVVGTVTVARANDAKIHLRGM